MFECYTEPHLRRQSGRSAVVVRTLRTFGAGESNIAEQIDHLMARTRNPAVGTTASEGVITVRIVARAEAADEAQARAQRDADEVRAILGPLVFGEDDDTLASVVGRELAARALTVATAESCTGGLLGKLLTDVSGSSAYYLGGFITYSNEAKVNVTGVPGELIETHGAVSEQVARALAEGCQARTGSDYGLATTGIAGPTGGTPEKQVGLVYIGLAGPSGSSAKRCQFSDRLNREAIRDRSAKTALNMLRCELRDRALLRNTKR
jgi:nicotinamide-nucleotide amidase